MEECVRLVCECLGLREDDEVGMERICSLYNNIFLVSTSLEEVKRAVAQVRGEAEQSTCSVRGVLHVLIVMDRQRENREMLYWDLQLMKAGRFNSAQEQNIQLHTHLPTISHSYKQQERDSEQFNILCLQNRAKRLYTRLLLDGVWSILESLSHRDVINVRQGSVCYNSSDILQLLHYKYDIIKERLYREMLQDECGMVWWDAMSPWQQTECVFEVGVSVEQAYRHRDWLEVCRVPGALRCYRTCASVVLQGSKEKPRDQAWPSEPREQSWSALIFLSELQSLYQEEMDSLSTLIDRVGPEALSVIYLSMCVAVRRAERENQSHAALLVAKQHWHRWPFMRGSVSQELARVWLQENLDPTAKQQQSWKTGSCVQQAVLQLLVLCQEQERKRLVEILHRVSLSECQGPESNNSVQGNAELQSCVSTLQQIKVSLQEAQASNVGPLAPGCSGIEVSWGECAVHLLTQLTQAHEDETWTVLYSLQNLEPKDLLTVLHRYETELHRPSFHNLRDVLQPHVLVQSTSSPNTGRERAEYIQTDSQDNEKQELCTGCGMALYPEETPYLEIVCVRDPEDELSMMETRHGGGERGEGDIESREEMFVEKQNSLITLAWSNPVHEDQIQEVTSAVQEVEAVATTLQEERRDQSGAHFSDTPHEDVSDKQSTLQPSTEERGVEEQRREAERDEREGEEQRRKTERGGEKKKGKIETAERGGEEQRGEIETSERGGEEQRGEIETAERGGEEQRGEIETAERGGEEQRGEIETAERGGEEQRGEIETAERGGEEQELQREATMRCLVNIQRRAERRWQRDRDRQLLRVQERLAIVQSRKADEDLLGLTQEDALRHLTHTLRQEDEQQQKTLVREKLEQMRRERSCVLQTRRERNTTGFKELISPAAQHMTETEDAH